MAGAFTHFIVCDVAKRKQELPGDLSKLLNKHSEFLFLGAASPDLPYLSLKTGMVNWADVMHYEKTDSIVTSGFSAIRSARSAGDPAWEIKFAWLMGYVSHLVADATVHPAVQATVGPYKEHSEEHRLCEMTQDSLIFNRQKNMDVRYAEFSSALKFCASADHFGALMASWKQAALASYAEKGEEPSPGLWFGTYTSAVDAAEGGSAIVGLFRHLGIGDGYLYKTKAEIVSDHPADYQKYYTHLHLPDGSIGSFEQVFEKAVENTLDAWEAFFSDLTTGHATAEIVKNWDLDTGVDMNSPTGEVTFWGVA